MISLIKGLKNNNSTTTKTEYKSDLKGECCKEKVRVYSIGSNTCLYK